MSNLFNFIRRGNEPSDPDLIMVERSPIKKHKFVEDNKPQPRNGRIYPQNVLDNTPPLGVVWFMTVDDVSYRVRTSPPSMSMDSFDHSFGHRYTHR